MQIPALLEKLQSLEEPEQFGPFLDLCEEDGVTVPGRDMIPEAYLYKKNILVFFFQLMCVAERHGFRLALQESWESRGRLYKYSFYYGASFIEGVFYIDACNKKYTAKQLTKAKRHAKCLRKRIEAAK